MKDLTTISKFLSLVLRHQPDTIGLRMDANGWVDVEELLFKMNRNNQPIDLETLEEVVFSNDKQRFSFSADSTHIRANQGHSIQVDVELTKTTPPEYLYHGTVKKFMKAIEEDGLQKMQRLYVHLSKDYDTAVRVANRRGQPVILRVLSGLMAERGFTFYVSKNGVWLCEAVPPQFIRFVPCREEH